MIFFAGFATPCQIYPSEYAYHGDSVNRAERGSANCRRYPSGLPAGPGVFTEQYIHCDGTQLRLIDFDLGSQEYSSSRWYEWSTGSARQLLFVFPTRVSLTTITLHYYSDSVRGLPRLRFYTVSDDFNVWGALHAGITNVRVAAVLPGGEPAGRRNVSINVNFNTKRVLLYIDKFSPSFPFAVSEVEFFKCNSRPTLSSISYSDAATTSTKIVKSKYNYLS